jgi:phosphoglycerate dehydrogenase-like enzyme
MLTGLYVMNPELFDDVYGPQERAEIERHLRITEPVLAADQLTPASLADVEVLVTGWGGPKLDSALLASAPKLALVLYGAGSVRSVVTPEFWARNGRITSAGTAIATAVAEFTLAQVLYALKHGWRYVLRAREAGGSAPRDRETGARGAVVGLVGFGATGRATARLLARHEMILQAYDPYADGVPGVDMVGLPELFATSDVISLHAPLLPATRGMVGDKLLSAMKPDATLVNTARGGLIDEPALIDVLHRRPDLFAVLDVTDPEPPVPGSALFTLPNVVVTPHLAGSLGPERRRQGQVMAAELERFAAGEPLRYEVTQATMGRSA